jgi:general secretion pathway protein L
LLGASPCLGNPGFQGQVQPDARTGKERFQINADLKECSPQTDAKVPAANAVKTAKGDSEGGKREPAAAPETGAKAGKQPVQEASAEAKKGIAPPMGAHKDAPARAAAAPTAQGARAGRNAATGEAGKKK